ncbi:hypothetical protein [Streptomyces sp. NPDC002922]|uniref:hypothetical protein n=1 Tax=Streptomyces sp. NPDC002922 TaxID=3154439 RepID=UPI0033B6C3AE
MSEVVIAGVAAAAAVLASTVTGYFTVRGAQRQAVAAWAAAQRQADAAWAAAQRQADAQLEVLRESEAEQHSMRLREVRRQAYVNFLNRCEQVEFAAHRLSEFASSRIGTPEHQAARDAVSAAHAALSEALIVVRLESPDIVAIFADYLWASLSGNGGVDRVQLEQAREDFLQAAKETLA